MESKNGSVVRRHLGHAHIPARFAPLVHEFASATLYPYLNWHHPRQFATEVVRGDGKVRKVDRDADLATPYEKLRSIAGAATLRVEVQVEFHWPVRLRRREIAAYRTVLPRGMPGGDRYANLLQH